MPENKDIVEKKRFSVTKAFAMRESGSTNNEIAEYFGVTVGKVERALAKLTPELNEDNSMSVEEFRKIRSPQLSVLQKQSMDTAWDILGRIKADIATNPAIGVKSIQQFNQLVRAIAGLHAMERLEEDKSTANVSLPDMIRLAQENRMKTIDVVSENLKMEGEIK